MSKKLLYPILAAWLLVGAMRFQATAGAADSDTAVAITTAVGKGADTTLENDGQSGNHGPTSLHGTSNSISIRRYDGTRQKMMYLRFDVSAAGGHLTEAILTFNVTSTANRARVWAIYGLTDETLDNWDEATICYNNAPGMLPAALASYSIDATKLRRLCTMNAGAAAGIYKSTADPNMDTFLAEDTNGLVSFLVIPNTSDSTATWYVSSKEATNLAPELAPTLSGLVVNPTRASQPSPADKEADVDRDGVLRWKPSENASKYNVYLGLDAATVGSGAAGTLVSPGQDVNSYDPPGHLACGQTYYWRVEELGAGGSIVSTGVVWQFTVEPQAYAIPSVLATASSSDVGTNPQNTVGNLGLDNNDLHGALDSTMWLSGKNDAGRPWIQFAFARIYQLHEMWVWNYNATLEAILGAGAKEVTVEYSTDGSTWTALGTTQIFNRAPASAGYAHNTTVALGDVPAQYVKLTLQSNWGGVVAQCGLSKVRFFYVPAQATRPEPAVDTVNIDPRTLVLKWKAGREAVSHRLYLGTDRQAVVDGVAPVVTLDEPTYAPPAPLLNTTYYWKVVEVNDAETPTSWTGDVWSFSTLPFLIVDNFESYTDEDGKAIFQTWIDGFAVAANGSQVGHTDPPYAEQTLVRSGRQAMPLFYANTAGATYSEAERIFESPQDWSKYGITTLSLWFRGDPNNAPAPLYVKINGTKILFDTGTPATTSAQWRQWNIDLTTLGATLQSIRTLTIGIGGGQTSGSGTIYLDDIRLYMTPPPVAIQTAPDAIMPTEIPLRLVALSRSWDRSAGGV